MHHTKWKIRKRTNFKDIKTDKDNKRRVRRENERQGYLSSMENGSELLNNYLSSLPKEYYPKIKQMKS